MRGMGRVFRRGTVFWVAYYHRGREYRESAKSEREADATRLLKQRLGEIQSRRFTGLREERLTFGDLAKAYEQDYQVRGLRSLDTAKLRASHLRGFFGTDRAIDITTDRIRAYQAFRRGQKAQAATINRETAALRRMFRIAVKNGLVNSAPVFPDRLEENPPRQGFFEHSEYTAVREYLPGAYRDVLDFAYYSGWRKKEITELTWAEVDREGRVIRLSPARSKTKLGRLLPISGPLETLINDRHANRRLDTPLVFHWNGVPIGDWRKTWHRACRLAKQPGKRLHDCRRTAARNLVRAGVPERVAMMLTGHKSRSVFDRYNIVSEKDLTAATQQLGTYLQSQAVAPTLGLPQAAGAGQQA